MPKSKRAKLVNLTKVKKKDKGWKEGVLRKAQALCDAYDAVYVVRHRNMRNDCFKELREDLKQDTAFMMGSTKKLQAALGRSPEEEHRPGCHKLAPHLSGFAGLIFTNKDRLALENVVSTFEHEDFARAGSKATQTVALPAGPLQGPHGVPFPHTMEHTLRAHGLPTKLNKGVIELTAAHTVCREGKPLSPHQAALLRHMDIRMAVFKLKLCAAVDKAGEYWEYDDTFSDEDGMDAGDAAGSLMAFDDGLPDDVLLPPQLAQL